MYYCRIWITAWIAVMVCGLITHAAADAAAAFHENRRVLRERDDEDEDDHTVAAAVTTTTQVRYVVESSVSSQADIQQNHRFVHSNIMIPESNVFEEGAQETQRGHNLIPHLMIPSQQHVLQRHQQCRKMQEMKRRFMRRRIHCAKERALQKMNQHLWSALPRQIGVMRRRHFIRRRLAAPKRVVVHVPPLSVTATGSINSGCASAHMPTLQPSMHVVWHLWRRKRPVSSIQPTMVAMNYTAANFPALTPVAILTPRLQLTFARQLQSSTQKQQPNTVHAATQSITVSACASSLQPEPSVAPLKPAATSGVSELTKVVPALSPEPTAPLRPVQSVRPRPVTMPPPNIVHPPPMARHGPVTTATQHAVGGYTRPVIVSSRYCPIPLNPNPENLEQCLALIELVHLFGTEQAQVHLFRLYPHVSRSLIQEYEKWKKWVLEPWLRDVLHPYFGTADAIPCPPIKRQNGRLLVIHTAWLLAYLRERFGFQQSQRLAYRLYGMAGVQQLIAAEAWKQNVLGSWIEMASPVSPMHHNSLADRQRRWRTSRWHAIQLREELQQVRRLRLHYEAWMHREEKLLEMKEYRQFMNTVLGNRYHRFLDRNHSPYYLFLSREMRRWIYGQWRRVQRERKHKLHWHRLKNDPHYYRRHYYITGVFPVMHSLLKSRPHYWRWHRRLHWRVWRAYRWRRMLRRMRKYYPHRHIPFRILNRPYLRYVRWVRRLSPFDIRNPLNPFNPFFGFGAPQSRTFRRWLRSLRPVPKWYWRAYPVRYHLPRGIRHWPYFWRRIPRVRMRPWYLRAPWKFDPRFNPYWPYFRKPRLPRLPWPFRWPRMRRPRFGRISFPRLPRRWPFRRPKLRWPFRRPRLGWPFRRPRFGWPFRRPRLPWPFRRPRLRLPYFGFPRLPRFRLPWPFASPYYYDPYNSDPYGYY